MKFSRFNIYKKYNDNEYWIYNTLTTAVVLIDKNIFEKIFLKKNFDIDDDNFNKLSEMGFLLKIILMN